ncbi:MAG: hypothetical protein ACKVW3_10305 [Phycisphaerales bacterium]
MELNFSPDIDAYWCYTVVILVGAFTAWRQMADRLGAKTWRAMQTLQGWALFLAYIAVPVALFWFLDRTGAIFDTSLFAAVVIAVAYDRILAGSLKSIPVAGGLTTSFWTPFVAWTDRVNASIAAQMRARDTRLVDDIIATVIVAPEPLDKMKDLARLRARDLPTLDTEIKKITDQSASLGTEITRERIARLCYNEVAGTPDYHRALLDRGLLSKFRYFADVIDLRSRLIFGGGVGILLAVLAFLLVHLLVPATSADYSLWRVQKQHVSKPDLARSRAFLARHLATCGAPSVGYCNGLVRALSWPETPVDRADVLISLLLEVRTGKDLSNDAVAVAMIPALRAPVDTRARVRDALVFLLDESLASAKPAEPRTKALAESLAARKKWNPHEDAATTSVEREVRAWSEAWSVANPATASSAKPAPGATPPAPQPSTPPQAEASPPGQ